MLPWQECARLPEDQLTRRNLAGIDISCAIFLPNFDVPKIKSMAIIDRWSSSIRRLMDLQLPTSCKRKRF
jgi:hypothetical protein